LNKPSILDKKNPSIREIEDKIGNPNVRVWLEPDGTVCEAPSIPVSYGDLVDKITTLEVKADKIEDEKKLVNINRELDQLTQVWNDLVIVSAGSRLESLRNELKETNVELWDVEHELRSHNKHENFGRTFVVCARALIRLNDLQSAIKQDVDELLGSVMVETYPH